MVLTHLYRLEVLFRVDYSHTEGTIPATMSESIDNMCTSADGTGPLVNSCVQSLRGVGVSEIKGPGEVTPH